MKIARQWLSVPNLLPPRPHPLMLQRRGAACTGRKAASPRWPRSAAPALRSQTWFSFFNGRYRSPAALPISAPFFFETETARLMFVRRCWRQRLYWWLFLRFPREDAAADYECGHDCPENPKLHLRHCGVLRRLTPLEAIIRRSAYQVLRKSPGSFATLPQSAAPNRG